MTIDIQQGGDKKWRWWICADNGKTLAVSHHAYARKTTAINAVKEILRALRYRDVRVTVDHVKEVWSTPR